MLTGPGEQLVEAVEEAVFHQVHRLLLPLEGFACVERTEDCVHHLFVAPYHHERKLFFPEERNQVSKAKISK